MVTLSLVYGVQRLRLVVRRVPLIRSTRLVSELLPSGFSPVWEGSHFSFGVLAVLSGDMEVFDLWEGWHLLWIGLFGSRVVVGVPV